jgi:hypothetical protein
MISLSQALIGAGLALFGAGLLIVQAVRIRFDSRTGGSADWLLIVWLH